MTQVWTRASVETQLLYQKTFFFCDLTSLLKLSCKQPENASLSAPHGHPAEFTNFFNFYNSVKTFQFEQELNKHSFTGEVCRSIAAVRQDYLHFHVHDETLRLHPEVSTSFFI